jgi:hypothetical protein
MPKGIYKRKKTYEKKILLARRGIDPWNKGLTKYQDLLTRIKWLLIIDGPLSLREIYSSVNSEITYKRLHGLLFRAKANGLIDRTLIRDGREFAKNKEHCGRRPKFKVGDTVRISPRKRQTPKWLLEEIRRIDTPRTVVQVLKGRRSYFYLLGTNSGSSPLEYYLFSPSELKLYAKGKIGRPRTKRAYNRKNGKDNGKLPVHPDNDLLTDLTIPPSILCVN